MSEQGKIRSPLGQSQEELLSELVHAGGWCEVSDSVCGSNYGGRSKHMRLVRSLERRGLVESRTEDCASGPPRVEVRAMPHAARHLD